MNLDPKPSGSPGDTVDGTGCEEQPRPSVTLCAYDRLGACGGTYAWAVEFAKSLQSWTGSVKVLVLCQGGKANSGIAASCEQSGIGVSVLDTSKAAILEDQIEWLLAEWFRTPSAVFIANLVLPAFYASRWIRLRGGRSLGVLHSNPDHDPFYAEMIRHFLGHPPEWRLDAMVAVSSFVAEKARTSSSGGTVVSVIPCGTRLPAAQATPPESALRLIYCGRLVREAKRIRELTEAFLQAAEIPGVTATICGAGEELPWVEARLQGQDKVRYAGSFPPGEMHKIMAGHHVIVLLSDYEGLPMALVEGMACGLAPVCLDEPSGAREIIQDGVNGFIVRDRGPDFLRAIERLKNPQLWRRLSTEAQRTAATRYSHEVVFAEWQALVRNLGAMVRVGATRPPRRIQLETPRREAWFAQYCQYRPTRLESLERALRASWTGLRLKTRPRARLRALLAPDKKS